MDHLAARVKQSRLYAPLTLERFVSHRLRQVFVTLCWLLGLVFVGLWFHSYQTGAAINTHLVLGLLLLNIVIGVSVYLLEGFFRSYYFHSILSNNYHRGDLFSFTVGRILYDVDGNDILPAFIQSETGNRVLRRLGLSKEELRSFLEARNNQSKAVLTLSAEQPLMLAGLVDWLYVNDESFSKFLFRHQIGQSELDGATAWVVSEIESRARAQRWWSREYLERIPSIAKDWSYGITPTLDKYSEDLLLSAQSSHFTRAVSASRPELRQLETILLRSREANAILVGPAGEGKMDVIWQLANEIKTGTIVPALEHKRPILLHTSILLASEKERQSFERTILTLLSEAAASGNVVLIIDNLSVLLAGAGRLGSELAALLNPYLSSPAITVIALADTDTFHRSLESDGELMQRFEVVKLGEADHARLISFLEETAQTQEKQYPLFFTYQAITELVAGAERYFQNESVADQALDLLIEIVPWAVSHGCREVGKEVVLQFLGEKTKIPMGAVVGSERESLLGLEDKLKGQVVGQPAALTAISQALRRGRAGLSSKLRPIGTFLFLGPTGVGKTETAKALARTMFGKEEALLRLDMSEYQSSDALNRLIGSFADNKPGILATLIRENPYGVLLLDEFEKTEKGVLNLFLQILDEGFFSDAFGRRVNARNLVFIATSNAAAELIWHLVESGRDPAGARTEIVGTLIEKGIFRPELLNRFDEIIFFHPLQIAELRQVARLMLVKTVSNLRGQGIDLRLTDELVNQVAQAGTDRVFGARPLRRYIQDKVEQQVADAIIRGDLRAGNSVEFRDGKLSKIA
jgi:ATP-dependent Clp protease ATP-binding subunit ClpC